MTKMLAAAWAYRSFITSSIASEFRGRLARSRLGVMWILLHPIAQVVIFAAVLSEVLSARIGGVDSRFGYVIFLLSGTACWTLFAEVVQRCLTLFIDNAHLLRKISFPRATLPLVAVGSALTSNVALVAVIVLTLPALGFWPKPVWLWLPPLMALTALLGAALGLLLGTLNVFARDVGQVTQVAMQFWFWLTPIVYPVAIVPESFRAFLALNPLMPLVDAYRAVLLYGVAPSPNVAIVLLIAIALGALSLFVFRRAAPEIVDAL